MLRPSVARLVQPNTDIAPFKGLIPIGTTHTINGSNKTDESIHGAFVKCFNEIVNAITIIRNIFWDGTDIHVEGISGLV